MKSLRVSFTLFLLMIALLVGMPAGAQETPTAEVPTETPFISETATPVETPTELPTETSTTETTASPEPTLEVTSTPTPEPPVDLPDNAVVTNGTQLVLLLILAAFGGGGFVAIITRFLESKLVRDLGEKLYEATSPAQQEWFKQRLVEAEETNRQWIAYFKAVSDGLPNAEPPNPFRGDVTRTATMPSYPPTNPPSGNG